MSATRRKILAQVFATVVAVVMMACAASTATAANLNVSLEVSENLIQIGDSIEVEISVEGAGLRSANPVLEESSYFVLQGRSSGSSISIVNGRTQSTKIVTLSMRAARAGKAQLGPAKVRYKGRTFLSNTVDIEIADRASVAPGQDPKSALAGEDVFIDVELTTTHAYPGQEVGVAFFLYVRTNLQGAEAVAYPSFPGSIPFKLAGGGKLNFMETKVGGVDYQVSPLQRYVIYPIAPGEATVDEFTLNVSMPERRRRRRNDPFGSFFGRSTKKQVSSPLTKILVKALPAQGRPPGFGGDVGVYKMSAALDKHRVETGEAVTLSITIEGRGNAEALTEPIFPIPEGLKGFTQAARDESVESFDFRRAKRVFESIIVPDEAGDYRIGPFSMHVFNPVKEEYEVISAPAQTLTATPDKNGGRKPQVLTKESIALAGSDIRTIKADAEHLRVNGKSLHSKPAAWALIFLTPFAFGLRAWLVRRKESLEMNEALARRIKAGKEAKKRLAVAKKAAAEDPASFGVELHSALMGFTADQINVEAPSLTAQSARQVLAERGVRAEDLGELAETLKTCDAMRYGGHAPDLSTKKEMLKKADAWIGRVQRSMKNGGAS